MKKLRSLFRHPRDGMRPAGSPHGRATALSPVFTRLSAVATGIGPVSLFPFRGGQEAGCSVREEGVDGLALCFSAIYNYGKANC